MWLVGFTESLIAPHIGLTSVEQLAEELGFISAQTLKMFHGDMKDEKTTLRLDGKLNIRSSSVKKNWKSGIRSETFPRK